MSAVATVIVPAAWNTTVPEVLRAAGFEVTLPERHYPDGSPLRGYLCTREGVTIPIDEVADPDTPSRLVLFVYARRKALPTLRLACDALVRAGARDTDHEEDEPPP